MGILNESYSSVDLAKILGVHRVTVTNWIKKGALKAGRTPGGRYRVTKKNLRVFLKERNMPVPAFLRRAETNLVVAVDDDEVILDLLKGFFSQDNMPYLYRLEAFSDPLDAALFIGDSKPDLVLLDLLMPQLNGFNLADKIKQTSPKTRIILITGHATKENLTRLNQCNVDAVVTKPFGLNDLKDAMEDSLRKGQTQEADVAG